MYFSVVYTCEHLSGRLHRSTVHETSHGSCASSLLPSAITCFARSMCPAACRRKFLSFAAILPSTSRSDKLPYSCRDLRRRRAAGRGRKSALTVDDKSHLPARAHHGEITPVAEAGPKRERLFHASLLSRGRVSMESRTSRDVSPKQVDCIPRRTYVRAGPRRLSVRKHESALRRVTSRRSAPLRALLASLIKSYDCTRHLLTSSYTCAYAGSARVVVTLILALLFFYRGFSYERAACGATRPVANFGWPGFSSV